jgi:hypothetical protein
LTSEGEAGILSNLNICSYVLQTFRQEVKMKRTLVTAGILVVLGLPAAAGSGPYFNTYTHHMETGEWELEAGADAVKTVEGPWEYGQQIELEHGFNEHWAGALYLLGSRSSEARWQVDGYKIETRFRPWTGNAFFRPAFYLEYEQFPHEEVYKDAFTGNAEHGEAGPFRTEHEAEARLIFSRDFDWGNLVVNLVAERSLDGGRTAFGYTGGFFLKGPSSGQEGSAAFDPDMDGDSHLLYGLELFGGLGEEGDLGLHSGRQEHYAQPFVALPLSDRLVLKAGWALGLTKVSEDRIRAVLVVRIGRRR